MKQQKMLLFAWIFLIVCMLLGGMLGIFIIGNVYGENKFDLIMPMVGGTLGGTIISIIMVKIAKKRRGRVPEFDERSMKLMQRYFMIVLYIILFGSGAALIVLYAMGIHMIETGMLIVCLLGLYLVIGLGAFVTKRL